MMYTSSIKLPKEKRKEQFVFLAGSMALHKKVTWRQTLIKKFNAQINSCMPKNVLSTSLHYKSV